jgi:hypothetical protein
MASAALPFNEWTEAFGSERLTGRCQSRLLMRHAATKVRLEKKGWPETSSREPIETKFASACRLVWNPIPAEPIAVSLMSDFSRPKMSRSGII